MSRDIALRIPFTTLLKVALFLLGVIVVMRLRPVLIMVILAAFIAVVLTPFKQWLERFVRPGLAVTIVALVVFGALTLLLSLVIPQAVTQAAELKEKAPELGRDVIRRFPGSAPYVRSILEDVEKPPEPYEARSQMRKGMMTGSKVVSGVAAVIFTIVLALYFVVDGKRAVAWLISFAPDRQRRKLAMTLEEVRPLAIAYMRGQLITSTLSFLTAAAVLVPLKVPAAMPLALLAFVGDFIPAVGFVIALVPAVALAATVSPAAAITVAAVYVTYQMIENYVISPRVYGRQMEMSTLTVLLAITVGGALLGPVGAILILPVVASYPPVEKIWLRGRLPEETLDRHEALEQGDRGAADEIVKP